MPVEVSSSPPERHHPSHSGVRPKGILKNPSFSGQGGAGPNSPTHDATQQHGHSPPPSAPLDPQEEKELTIQNTLQNAGHRRSSSAARRSSASRRHSSAAGLTASSSNEEDTDEKMRLKWDEANLYLTEQDRGGRMKITEPKTPFEYGMGTNAMEEEEEEDVSIDPRFVNVDEVDMAAKKKGSKKARESDIPGLELGEPEFEGDGGASADAENERIVRQSSLSRESSKEKHVALGEGYEGERPGMPSSEDEEKHRVFEEQRKRHYEMRNVKDMLGHPEDLDEDEDEDTHMTQDLPRRGVNGRA